MSKTETHRNELQIVSEKEMCNLHCKRNCGGCGWQRQPNHTYNERMDVVLASHRKSLFHSHSHSMRWHIQYSHTHRDHKNHQTRLQIWMSSTTNQKEGKKHNSN